jgi:hypothetical protein
VAIEWCIPDARPTKSGEQSVSPDVGSLRVELYTADRVAMGVLVGVHRFKDHLESNTTLVVHRPTLLSVAGGSETIDEVRLEADDVIIAVAAEATHGPVHATWHPIHLEAGPYVIDGELATMPGFDPGRALTRPSGEFVVLRDVQVSLLAYPEAGTATHPEALINRYAVDKVDADLMLGFFFPGAHVEPTENPGPKQAAAPSPG